MDKHQNISDQQLLENFYTEKDNHWLGILLQRYTLLLLGVCMKYMKNEQQAKDCVQQIFLKVITELQKYKVTYFKSWLYMVAKNHCLMQLRNNQGKRNLIIDDTFSIEDETIDKQKLNDKEKTYKYLNEGIDLLNTEQQQCVILFYLENKSYAEVSTATGLSMLQVKSHIQNGKRNLKIFIEKKLHDESH